MFIAGDVGGTKVHLACYEEGTPLRSTFDEKYASRDFSDFPSLIQQFLSRFEHGQLRSATFGIAGPVKNGVCQATNLPWIISAEKLQKDLGIPQVFLINDLEANAWGLKCLGKDELFELNKGEENVGNQALISAGTGLGEAGLYWNGKSHLPFACEGGHCDFSPTSEEEIDLLRYLKGQFEHVSFERLLSGNGIYQLYRFFVDTQREKENPTIASSASKEPQRLVFEQATTQKCPASTRACQLFARIYGAEAGNLALKLLATGGVYVGGGIAPRFLSFLQENDCFMKAFTAKGRFTSILKAIPVKIVLNDQTALLGAARYGQEKSR
ncbi:MAG: glucokinase [Chlamydiota bacterium]